MDNRVLIRNGLNTPAAPIAELQGWTPEPASLAADGAIKKLAPVSLVVPTFFNSELKRRSLRYLLAGLRHSRAVQEIIFVSSDGENQSFDDLRPYAEGRPIRVVESDPHNRGKSRNVGAAAATSRYLLFLDDDMLLRNWRVLDVILSRMLSSGEDAALFPRRHYAKFPLLFDPPTLEKVIAQWRREGGAGNNPFLFDPLNHGERDLPMLFCFPGCFMLISRAAFQGMGGFDEEFVGWGFEDTEFGMRAMNELRVLNLFREGEPLLHIDHPVSPYKSEEHNANYRKFYSSAASIDVNLFCRRVFSGDDFHPTGRKLNHEAALAEPFEELARRGVPIDLESLRPWCLQLARQRQLRHLSPLPQFIALHGSRARTGDEGGGDFDVLSLYQGTVQDFFVSNTLPRVELECADVFRFEHIAAHPAIHSFQGPMELAKVAQSRLLWGDAKAWRAWSDRLIGSAMKEGWCFWLVFGLGLRWHASKYGPMVERYFNSLMQLRMHTGAVTELGQNGHVNSQNESSLIEAAREALDQFRPGWREQMDQSLPIFELQVPEVWTALHRLRHITDTRFPVTRETRLRVSKRRRRPAALATTTAPD